MAEDIQQAIKNIISEIEEESAEGKYIYRGEAECYKEISSSLRRQLNDQMRGVRNFDVDEEIEIVQAEDLAIAKDYTHMTSDFDILTLLQHFGGVTNLIDFTTDYHIALFFACEKSFANDGRVILLKRTEAIDQKYLIKKPRQQLMGRLEAQNSIFVRSSTGFIEPHEISVVTIPKEVKSFLLRYLQQKNIFPVTVYNDLLGFIKFQRGFRDSFMAASLYFDGDSETRAERLKRTFANIESVLPSYARFLNYRGMAYEQKGDLESAMKEYDQAIVNDPNYIDALLNRARLHKLRSDDALSTQDLARVLELHRPNLNT